MRDQPLYYQLVSLVEACAAAHHALSEHPVRHKDPRRLSELRRETALALAAIGTVYSRSEHRPLSFAEVEARTQASLDDLCMRRLDLVRCIELLRSSAARADATRLRAQSKELVSTSKDTVEQATANAPR